MTIWEGMEGCVPPPASQGNWGSAVLIVELFGHETVHCFTPICVTKQQCESLICYLRDTDAGHMISTAHVPGKTVSNNNCECANLDPSPVTSGIYIHEYTHTYF